MKSMAWSISGSSEGGLDHWTATNHYLPKGWRSPPAVFATSRLFAACRQGKPGQLSCPTTRHASTRKMTEMLEPQGHLAGTGSGTTGGSYRPAPVVPLGRSGTSHWDSGTTELSW